MSISSPLPDASKPRSEAGQIGCSPGFLKELNKLSQRGLQTNIQFENGQFNVTFTLKSGEKASFTFKDTKESNIEEQIRNQIFRGDWSLPNALKLLTNAVTEHGFIQHHFLSSMEDNIHVAIEFLSKGWRRVTLTSGDASITLDVPRKGDTAIQTIVRDSLISPAKKHGEVSNELDTEKLIAQTISVKLSKQGRSGISPERERQIARAAGVTRKSDLIPTRHLATTRVPLKGRAKAPQSGTLSASAGQAASRALRANPQHTKAHSRAFTERLTQWSLDAAAEVRQSGLLDKRESDLIAARHSLLQFTVHSEKAGVNLLTPKERQQVETALAHELEVKVRNMSRSERRQREQALREPQINSKIEELAEEQLKVIIPAEIKMRARTLRAAIPTAEEIQARALTDLPPRLLPQEDATALKRMIRSKYYRENMQALRQQAIQSIITEQVRSELTPQLRPTIINDKLRERTSVEYGRVISQCPGANLKVGGWFSRKKTAQDLISETLSTLGTVEKLAREQMERQPNLAESGDDVVAQYNERMKPLQKELARVDASFEKLTRQLQSLAAAKQTDTKEYAEVDARLKELIAVREGLRQKYNELQVWRKNHYKSDKLLQLGVAKETIADLSKVNKQLIALKKQAKAIENAMKRPGYPQANSKSELEIIHAQIVHRDRLKHRILNAIGKEVEALRKKGAYLGHDSKLARVRDEIASLRNKLEKLKLEYQKHSDPVTRTTMCEILEDCENMLELAARGAISPRLFKDYIEAKFPTFSLYRAGVAARAEPPRPATSVIAGRSIQVPVAAVPASELQSAQATLPGPGSEQRVETALPRLRRDAEMPPASASGAALSAEEIAGMGLERPVAAAPRPSVAQMLQQVPISEPHEVEIAEVVDTGLLIAEAIMQEINGLTVGGNFEELYRNRQKFEKIKVRLNVEREGLANSFKEAGKSGVDINLTGTELQGPFQQIGQELGKIGEAFQEGFKKVLTQGCRIPDVPLDGSCLFTSLAVALKPELASHFDAQKKVGMKIRGHIADAIAADPESFKGRVNGRIATDERVFGDRDFKRIYGQPRNGLDTDAFNIKCYCEWIRMEGKWGSEIEVAAACINQPLFVFSFTDIRDLDRSAPRSEVVTIAPGREGRLAVPHIFDPKIVSASGTILPIVLIDDAVTGKISQRAKQQFEARGGDYSQVSQEFLQGGHFEPVIYDPNVRVPYRPKPFAFIQDGPAAARERVESDVRPWMGGLVESEEELKRRQSQGQPEPAKAAQTGSASAAEPKPAEDLSAGGDDAPLDIEERWGQATLFIEQLMDPEYSGSLTIDERYEEAYMLCSEGIAQAIDLDRPDHFQRFAKLHTSVLERSFETACDQIEKLLANLGEKPFENLNAAQQIRAKMLQIAKQQDIPNEIEFFTKLKNEINVRFRDAMQAEPASDAANPETPVSAAAEAQSEAEILQEITNVRNAIRNKFVTVASNATQSGALIAHFQYLISRLNPEYPPIAMKAEAAIRSFVENLKSLLTKNPTIGGPICAEVMGELSILDNVGYASATDILDEFVKMLHDLQGNAAAEDLLEQIMGPEENLEAPEEDLG